MLFLRRLVALVGTLCLASAISPNRHDDWCASVEASVVLDVDEQERLDRAAIEAHPVCIGSRVWSAGTLADTVLYEYRRHGDYLTVGYFVHWTTERPWGTNGLTYSLLPALALDALYSHTLFLLPGARYALYGPGDVEGASVTYRQEPSSALVPIGGLAEDARHNPVLLTAEDLDAGGRTALVTDVWSHQLGGRGGARLLRDVLGESEQRGSGTWGRVRCFSGSSLQPLPDTVARTFRLGSPHAPRRAKPAWQLHAVHDDSSRIAVVR